MNLVGTVLKGKRKIFGDFFWFMAVAEASMVDERKKIREQKYLEATYKI